ncbi:MAG: hypothetical protein M0R17_15035 [Candidatus Omnitrophica bacterium]|jgi:hypothetical protein|nr:hypothetical protein [Candidatus Omnitrophota bacterium]
MIKKLMSKIQCSPLSCFSVFFLINLALFGWIKSDMIQIRQELSGIYVLLVPNPQKIALLSPVVQNSLKKALPPG